MDMEPGGWVCLQCTALKVLKVKRVRKTWTTGQLFGSKL